MLVGSLILISILLVICIVITKLVLVVSSLRKRASSAEDARTCPLTHGFLHSVQNTYTEYNNHDNCYDDDDDGNKYHTKTNMNNNNTTDEHDHNNNITIPVSDMAVAWSGQTLLASSRQLTDRTTWWILWSDYASGGNYPHNDKLYKFTERMSYLPRWRVQPRLVPALACNSACVGIQFATELQAESTRRLQGEWWEGHWQYGANAMDRVVVWYQHYMSVAWNAASRAVLKAMRSTAVRCCVRCEVLKQQSRAMCCAARHDLTPALQPLCAVFVL